MAANLLAGRNANLDACCRHCRSDDVLVSMEFTLLAVDRGIVNGQPKMDINGHEKSPQTANSQEVKALSFSKLIGMSNQYNFEGASKLDESGDCRENP